MQTIPNGALMLIKNLNSQIATILVVMKNKDNKQHHSQTIEVVINHIFDCS